MQARQRRREVAIVRRSWLWNKTGFSFGGLLVLVALHWYLWARDPSKTLRDNVRDALVPENWAKHRDEVRDAFAISWDSYAQHGFGYDQYHPISQSGSQMSPDGLGWIIVDSLDTLMIMNLTDRLAQARRWIYRELDYDQDQDVNTFETTIRMLGGLLSAHYLSSRLPNAASKRDHIYLKKSVDLADRLLGAYTSASGLPYASIDLHTRAGLRSHADGGASSTAEATTLQIEMKYLSNLTGNGIYWRKAERIMQVVDNNRALDGLVPISSTRRLEGSPLVRYVWVAEEILTMYLIKQYLQTSEQEPVYRDMWQEALFGIEQNLLVPTRKSRLNMIAELPHGIGGPLSPKMDHLVCFLPGAIALGATNGLTEAEARKLPHWTKRKSREMRLARELMKSCWAMYKVTATGIAPEIVWFNGDSPLAPSQGISRSRDNFDSWKDDFIVKPLDAHNLQRPETVESLFLMWRITRDPIYRHWGLAIFRAFQRHAALENNGGYTSLNDVNAIPPPRRDNMESFWMAETLKYLYLLFSPCELLPLDQVVFNTEAHVFPKIELGKFSTGWQRRS